MTWNSSFCVCKNIECSEQTPRDNTLTLWVIDMVWHPGYPSEHIVCICQSSTKWSLMWYIAQWNLLNTPQFYWFKQYLLDQPNTRTIRVQYYHARASHNCFMHHHTTDSPQFYCWAYSPCLGTWILYMKARINRKKVCIYLCAVWYDSNFFSGITSGGVRNGEVWFKHSLFPKKME